MLRNLNNQAARVVSQEGESPSRSYSDLVVAAIVVMIIALMIMPLPHWVVDSLVAVNILTGVGLVLLAIYIPAATSFSSFPSVIMISTLFRLALSIAITRLILLDGEAGEIIETFGNMVVGGNIVVGIVVFLIITVVQFIVIAKGAERVAEVSARFTLDAMPGKQLSIDSDLRSGLLDRDSAREKRRLLELESQLHGSLDGAMKFVKGDAIAGMVILVVNIVGGLAIGVMQRGMALGDAVQKYSVLTIGDGLVAQVPALLTSIAAGLIITRTASEGHGEHLGQSISRQIASYPRVLSIGSVACFLLAVVPGFPWPVFILLGLSLLVFGFWSGRLQWSGWPWQGKGTPSLPADHRMLHELSPSVALRVCIATSPDSSLGKATVTRIVDRVVNRLRERYGVPLPSADIGFDGHHANGVIRVFVWGQSLGDIVTGTGAADSEQAFEQLFEQILVSRLSLFMGIQEVSDLVNRWAESFPDLVKEMLRVVSPQRLAEIMRQLLAEGIPVRNLRLIFDLLADAGSREKDPGMLTEMVRAGMSDEIASCFADERRNMEAFLLHPSSEDVLLRSVRPGTYPAQLHLELESAKRLLGDIRTQLESASSLPRVLICSPLIRAPLRRLVAAEFPQLPVLSHAEIAADVRVTPVGQLKF